MRIRALRLFPFVLLLTATLGATPAPAQDDEAPDVQQAERIEVGDKAPDFTLPDLEGASHRLADLRGEKPLILVFFRGAW